MVTVFGILPIGTGSQCLLPQWVVGKDENAFRPAIGDVLWNKWVRRAICSPLAASPTPFSFHGSRSCARYMASSGLFGLVRWRWCCGILGDYREVRLRPTGWGAHTGRILDALSWEARLGVVFCLMEIYVEFSKFLEAWEPCLAAFRLCASIHKLETSESQDEYAGLPGR